MMLGGGFTLPAVAQDPTADDKDAQFEQAFADFRESASWFEALRSEFQTADDARRAAINAELATAYPTIKEKVNLMVTAALDAYKASPNTDPRVTDLLLDVASKDVQGVGPSSQGGDNYERAAEVIAALIDGGQVEKEPRLPIWGLVAAFVTQEYDAAEKYKKLAAESGAWSRGPDGSDRVAQEVFSLAMQYGDMIDSYRQLWAQEQEIRQAEATADDLPRVKLQTSKGDIVIELFENEAPQAVANFVSLVKEGFYDGVVFHRVLPRFMAQGGDPTGTGSGGPGYNIPCECYQENARKHFRGTLSMAHAGRDTGGSQFFLTFMPTSHLDGRHTVFGRVYEGMEVLAELQRINPGERGVEPDKIIKAEVLRDRGHGYEFKKLPGR